MDMRLKRYWHAHLFFLILKHFVRRKKQSQRREEIKAPIHSQLDGGWKCNCSSERKTSSAVSGPGARCKEDGAKREILGDGK